MANVKITELTTYTNPVSSDVLPIVDVGADATKKVTITNILNNASNGSASRPAFSFNNDEDTGMFLGATGNLRFATGGTVGLQITSDQKIGIGTGSPTKKLVVTEDVAFNSVIIGRGEGSVSTNLVCGAQALENNTTGHSILAVGFQALQANTEGTSNTAVGREALESNTTASFNTAVGNKALQNNTTGANNTALGNAAMQLSTNGDGNTALGYQTMKDTTVGQRNLAVGSQALQSNVAGSRSTAVGFQAMLYADNTATATAKNNCAVGYTALRGSNIAANNTGHFNVCVGNNTMLVATSGGSNTVVGHNAGNDITTADKNILIGFGAGDEITTGDNNTILGDVPGTAAQSGQIILAAGSSERLRIDSAGRVLLGASTSATTPSFSRLQLIGNTQALSSQLLSRSSADNGASTIFFAKSRGTTSSPSIVSSGDEIGKLRFHAYDGTDFTSEVAAITAAIDGAPGENDTPGRLIFSTTANGASSPTERMRIKRDGRINFSNVQTFADEAAATAGGLASGDIYKTSNGELMIKA